MSEEKEVGEYAKVTLDEVRNFSKPTDGFLCPIEANIYGVEFVHFKIRNA